MYRFLFSQGVTPQEHTGRAKPLFCLLSLSLEFARATVILDTIREILRTVLRFTTVFTRREGAARRRGLGGATEMGDDELDEASKLKIAANFINYSPPGQIQKVVEDVKVLLGGHVPRSTLDSLMVKVNSTSFLAVDVPGEGRKVLITPFGDLGDGTFLDPMGLQRLTIDHGKQVCTSAEALSGAEAASLDAHEKGQVDAAMTRYAANKLPDAVVTTYCKVVGTATQITCCIGRWRRWLKAAPCPSVSAPPRAPA